MPTTPEPQDLSRSLYSSVPCYWDEVPVVDATAIVRVALLQLNRLFGLFFQLIRLERLLGPRPGRLACSGHRIVAAVAPLRRRMRVRSCSRRSATRARAVRRVPPLGRHGYQGGARDPSPERAARRASRRVANRAISSDTLSCS